MKPTSPFLEFSCPHHSPRRGFALIVTLSLMILLTVIAVGLLSLSSIGLRTSAQGNAISVARANARLALLLALGDLQKHAGPDQRISARADIIKEDIASPRLTGVWDSWEIKPTSQATDYEKSARDAKFRCWLVSGDPLATKKVDFASRPPLATTATGSQSAPAVTLWGAGTMGAAPFAKSIVTANKIALVSPRGAVAWAVMDEGVKVRINTPYVESATTNGQRTAQLGTGQRPDAAWVSGADPEADKASRPLQKLTRTFFKKGSDDFATIEKGITPENFSLAGEQLAAGLRKELKPLGHDITTQSVGLFTDTARGGLKQDFQLLTNTGALPDLYKGKGVYDSRGVMPTAGGPSDPSWDSLYQFARLYRDKITDSAGLPVVKVTAPPGWTAATKTGTPPVTTLNRKPPPGVVLLPTIAKVQILFSLIGRDIYSYPAFKPGTTPPLIPESAGNMHGPQDAHFRGTKYDYDLHLLYTPIVTLHNPYNVALEFSSMRLEFIHVPFAMQIFRNGIAQSRGLVPMETMFGDNSGGASGKGFGLNLFTKVDQKPGSEMNFRMQPGEVKLFSPYIDPNRTYAQEMSNRTFWDIYVGTGLTNTIKAMPGLRPWGVGFDLDWLAGAQKVNGNKEEGRWESCIGIARDDKFHVLFAPLGTPLSKNKFTITTSVALGSAATKTLVSAIEMDYETPTGLQDSILGKDVTLRYPKADSETIAALDLIDHATTPISQIVGARPFALLSAQAKTTSGARDASNEDGRIATKPWAFAHANSAVSSQKVVSEHSANHSHEIDLQLLEKGPADLLSVDLQDRSNFISGHTVINGTKFGAMYDLPLAPLQTLASLNGANPGGSSGFLPRFAQPIGNSWAHPLISPDRILESKAGGNYLDHSFLLNLALYDNFYFSGLGDELGPFGSGKTTGGLTGEFAKGTPLNDPRLRLHRPNTKPTSELVAEIGKPTAYSSIAGWQVMDGAFNINSTSVPAWKAMLTSIHDSQALCNQLNKTTGASKLTNLTATPSDKARVSRFRLPASTSAADGAETKDGYWLGPREFSDAEIQSLAENIVKQVRLRGPFLSMAEFVNRRLGPDSDEMAQRGALQQAIDDSDINRKIAEGGNQGYDIPAAAVAKYKYANPAAGAGASYQGAPGYLTQADVLNVLGNAATARSDTFTIRGYGESRDTSGKMLASATCEATVQRLPEWVDSADLVETPLAALTSVSNQIFGRRFVMTAFRWLSSGEI